MQRNFAGIFFIFLVACGTNTLPNDAAIDGAVIRSDAAIDASEIPSIDARTPVITTCNFHLLKGRLPDDVEVIVDLNCPGTQEAVVRVRLFGQDGEIISINHVFFECPGRAVYPSRGVSVSNITVAYELTESQTRGECSKIEE